MVAIGNDEPCPFCKGKDKFVAEPNNDFLKHLLEKHSEKAEEYLFGNKNINL